MVARLGGNLTSRKKFLALPASKKFRINHREATSSTWLGRGAGGHEQKLPTLLNSVCVRAYGVITSRLPTPNATYSSSIIPLKTGGITEPTSVPPAASGSSVKPFYRFFYPPFSLSLSRLSSERRKQRQFLFSRSVGIIFEPREDEVSR